MRFVGLTIAILLTSFSSLADSSKRITKDFVAHEYACYQDSLDALDSAIDIVKYSSENWCERNKGLYQYLANPGDLKVIVYSEGSPLTGGCVGDVTVKATFACLVD